MPPSLSFLRCRRAAIDAVARPDALRILLIAALHAAALALMAWSEVGTVSKAVFLLVWGLFNFFWLALLRRPAVSAALSLAMIVALILLSRLKYDMIWMTVDLPRSVDRRRRHDQFPVHRSSPTSIAGLSSRSPWRCRRWA